MLKIILISIQILIETSLDISISFLNSGCSVSEMTLAISTNFSQIESAQVIKNEKEKDWWDWWEKLGWFNWNEKWEIIDHFIILSSCLSFFLGFDWWTLLFRNNRTINKFIDINLISNHLLLCYKWPFKVKKEWKVNDEIRWDRIDLFLISYLFSYHFFIF